MIKKNNDIIFEEIQEGGLLLYNNVTKETHILNETAALIFNYCDGTDLDSIFNSYIRVFDSVDSDEVLQQKIKYDFMKTIEILKERNIVKMISMPSL